MPKSNETPRTKFHHDYREINPSRTELLHLYNNLNAESQYQFTHVQLSTNADIVVFMYFIPLIIPLGHDKLTVTELPFATIGIIVLCLLIYFPSSTMMEEGQEEEQAARELMLGYFKDHTHLDLPREIVSKWPKIQRDIYRAQRSWIDWYQSTPKDAKAFLDNHKSSPRRSGSDSMTELMEVIGASGNPLQGSEALIKQNALGDEKKYALLHKIDQSTAATLAEEQSQLNDLVAAYQHTKENSFLGRFGYVPASPTPMGIITHQFLHGGILHLLFNMIFLWVAAVKLEDIWGRGLFVALYLFFGIVGALSHQGAHPTSEIPMVGASGAVAGLMGAFLVRLGRAQVKCFYIYWLISPKPKSGIMDIPAYLLLPLWFLGEFMSAAILDTGSVAYWAHVGGFAAGVAVALVFKLTDFETKILKREPDIEIDTDAAPLVAFQNAGQPSPHSPNEQAVAPSSTPETTEPKSADAALSPLTKINYKEIAPGFIGTDRLISLYANGEQNALLRDNVEALAVGRIDRIEPVLGNQVFNMGIPKEPAYILAILQPSGNADNPRRNILFINSERCKWKELVKTPHPSNGKNIAALATFLIRVFPKASYIHGPGNVDAQKVPIYANLDLFIRHIQKSAIH